MENNLNAVIIRFYFQCTRMTVNNISTNFLHYFHYVF